MKISKLIMCMLVLIGLSFTEDLAVRQFTGLHTWVDTITTTADSLRIPYQLVSRGLTGEISIHLKVDELAAGSSTSLYIEESNNTSFSYCNRTKIGSDVESDSTGLWPLTINGIGYLRLIFINDGTGNSEISYTLKGIVNE